MWPVVRVGVAGLGFASTLTIPALASHPWIKITAAADPRAEARERFAREFDAKAFASVEDLCRRPDVDVVYVSTPNALHAECAILAAEHGKHVLVEKPLALTLEQADAMVAAAQRCGVYLLYGHTHSYDPPIRKLREIVRAGELGRLTMMQTWNYTDLLYRPRAAWELDTATGGGVVYVQAPHQVDMLRWIGGGLVRSVRGMTGIWDAERPTEGSYTAYLEFVDGTPATMVYNAYAHFDTAELHYWLGERGLPRPPETHARTLAEYRARQATGGREAADRDARRYGGAPAPAAPAPPAAAPTRHQYFFGLLLVSCERSDLRQSPDGLYLYGAEGRQEIPVPLDQTGNERMVEELYQAVANGRPPTHDGRWGRATLEVCLAILQSARERREVFLTRQVPTRD